ncbi:MAG: carbohydrate porin, partial [Chitinophagaceae bacterium]
THSARRFNLHFQLTYIFQYSARFKSPYSGPNSLSGDEERQNSLTTTLYLGARLWKGASVYVNPEIAGGSGLSGAQGMGGSSNGETYRVGIPTPTLYLGRAYFNQNFALSKEGEYTSDDANIISEFVPKNRLSLMLGKFSLGDLFDNNNVSNSPRRQFMNWAFINTGSWDYAANVRGYTLAVAGKLVLDKTTFTAAVAELPEVANGDTLSTDLNKSIALNAQVSQQYCINKRTGNIHLLGFYNKTHMGNYAEANTPLLPNPFPFTPDIVADRKEGRTKVGFALNADQQLTNDLSAFTRIGWSDGKNETWCFTEIDQTFALGASLKGNKWNRPDDEIGLAAVANGISKEHRNYLANGGLGFILGDGKLNYAPEGILEFYYSYKALKQGLWLSADYQLCLNPGYNQDRGPANIASLRVHVEL